MGAAREVSAAGGHRELRVVARAAWILRSSVLWFLLAASAACFAPAARAQTWALRSPEAYGLLAISGNFVPGGTLAERIASYQRLRRLGARAVRIDLRWTSVQPVGGTRRFDFSATDREVAAIRRAGLEVIGILGYGHPDYSSAGRRAYLEHGPGGSGPFGVGDPSLYPPDDPASFAAFVRATVRRYRSAVAAWEVWNEENEGWRFWEPKENPAAYARLLCAASSAVHSVEHHAPVAFGGVFFPPLVGTLGTPGPAFVQAVFRAHPGVGRCFDALAYHPYAYPFTSPEAVVAGRGSVLGAAATMRRVLRSNGSHAPLWITEIGWPSNPRGNGVSEVTQARYLARTTLATFASGVPVLTWYTYGDGADPGGLNQEAHFGLFALDGTRKPAARALRTLTTLLAGAHFVADRSRALRLPRGRAGIGEGFALEYRRRATTILALWLANERPPHLASPLAPVPPTPPRGLHLSLPVSPAAELRIVDWLGRRPRVHPRHGRVTLSIGQGPLYLLDTGPASSTSPRR